ncbi:hydroxylase [Enemella dayhoffiae]|uniref:Hydroxylase n=1 Tax=Enemella dayhoffiae TaxID=2016507 RepID=A0A255GVC1_9ACTN|nr:ferritin-like fold-containing protein [Enemella dayhoffiae]OYO19402.1 hydroxylase [Enemella dayhoffiae]
MSETPREVSDSSTAAIDDDGGYGQGVVDLLGTLAYGELTAFQRLADDAAHAPTLADKVMMASMAAQQINHFDRVRSHLLDRDVDVMVAMEPFQQPFDAYHDFARPRSWLEGMVKTYVGDGFAADFYREVAAYVDPQTRDLVFDVLADDRAGDYIVGRVRQACAEDPKVAGRLALWGRRLVGEALTQAQRVAADRDALTGLLTGAGQRPGMPLDAIGRMFARLTENHALRMERLGLAS